MPLRKTNDAACGMPAKAKQTAAMVYMSRPIGDIKIDFGKAGASAPSMPALAPPLLQLKDQTDSQESAASAKSATPAPLQVEGIESQESAASAPKLPVASPAEPSKGHSQVEKVLGDLKQKLAQRKGDAAAEKTEKKRTSPKKKKGKENKDPAPKGKPVPKGKAKAKVKSKKEAAKTSNAQTETTKRPVVEAKNDEPLPAWWNCKEKNHELFPEDTAKRFSSRCYHRILEKELKRGIDKNSAKLLAQSAHRDALLRWKTWHPEA